MTFKLIAVPQKYNFTSCFMCVKIVILLFENEVLRSAFEASEYRLEEVHIDGGFFPEQKSIYICYIFMRATRQANLIPLDLITLTILSKSYILKPLSMEFSPILWRFTYSDTVSNDSFSSSRTAVKIVQ
jgi:hypothetical protein